MTRLESCMPSCMSVARKTCVRITKSFASKWSSLNNPRKPHKHWASGVIADGRFSQFDFQ